MNPKRKYQLLFIIIVLVLFTYNIFGTIYSTLGKDKEQKYKWLVLQAPLAYHLISPPNMETSIAKFKKDIMCTNLAWDQPDFIGALSVYNRLNYSIVNLVQHLNSSINPYSILILHMHGEDTKKINIFGTSPPEQIGIKYYILIDILEYDMESERLKADAEFDKWDKLYPRCLRKIKIKNALDKYVLCIYANDNYFKQVFKQPQSLVLLAVCHGAHLKNGFFNSYSASAVFGSYDYISPAEIAYNSIYDLLLILSGSKNSNVKEEAINNSLSEASMIWNKQFSNSIFKLFVSDSGVDKVLYTQPKIISIKITQANEVIYSYEYSDIDPHYPNFISNINPIRSICKTKGTTNAIKAQIIVDGKVNLQAISKDISKTDIGTMFRLYDFSTINGSDLRNADYIDPVNMEYEYDWRNRKTVFTVEYDLSKLKNIRYRQATLLLTAKIIDYNSSDEMHFLDTNGSGREDGQGGEPQIVYADPNDGLDTNHWFWTAPAVTVKQSAIYDLHYPQLFAFEMPPSKPILQTHLSNAAPPYDQKKFNYLFEQCNALPVWHKLACQDNAILTAIKWRTLDFYLGPEIMPKASAAHKAAEPIVIDHYDEKGHSLEKSLQPVYVAIVKTIDENKDDKLVPPIEQLARSESFREEVKLWLDAKQIIPNSGDGNNRFASSDKSVEISDLYDIYLVKDAPDQALVVLPLKRLYDNPKAASFPDGSHTLRIETSLKGSEEAKDKGYATSQLLTYVKDFTPGYDAGSEKGTPARKIRDDGSGFSNYMLNYWLTVGSEKKASLFDMALNEVEIPSPKKDTPVDSSDNYPTEDTSSPTDENYKPPSNCTQYSSLSCRREEVNACHYKNTCTSTDFAICLQPFPHVTNPTINTTWNAFKINDKSCESQEDYGTDGKFGVIPREGEPVEGEKPEDDEPDDTDDPGQGTTEDDEKDKDENHSPVITSIKAVRDPNSPTGVSLSCTWEDEDNDLVTSNTRIYLVPDFDLNKFRELNITDDIETNRVNQSGCLLSDIRDLTEGKFGVKVHVEDEQANSTDEVKLLYIQLDPPKISEVSVDKDNMLITAVVSDEGSPIDKLNLNFPVIYNFSYIDSRTAKFTVPIPPENEKDIFKQFQLKVTDLAPQTAQKNFYRDIYPPDGSMKHDEDEKKLVTDLYDVDFESGIDITRADLIIDGVVYKNYKVEKSGDIYKIIFNSSYLTEGMHTGYVKACDYNNNCSQTPSETFHVAWLPEIYYFNYHQSKADSTTYLEAKVWDSGKNLDPDGFELKIDGQVIPETDYNYNPDDKLFTYYPANPFSSGEHTATLIARDTTGLFDTETITFKSSGITNLILTDKIYRDIEGNGDGIINEGERIYLDLGVRNAGDALTQNTWGDLVSRSRYIKGVTEKTSRYGFIQPGETVYNDKPFEFVVNEKVFEREDIDRVEAEFVLQLRESDPYSGGKSKTTEILFTLVIERMDPAMALFEISVKKPATPTMEPALRLEGSWKTFGTDLRTLDIRITQDSLPVATVRNSLSVFQKDLTVVKNDAAKTFYADATLGVGDNRFVVTATADNGVVRTAEVSVKLTSQVGIALDEIAETASPNVTVTGRAWTVNSKLESVEVYVNGGSMGSVPFDGDGRFSLPVTLNGGENIIRAVARDDQGKIAADEITVRMQGPLTIRWARANFRTTTTPIEACGSYQVEGDDIASIVTYINSAPNTHQVTIDRNLKTFCTTFDLIPGNNLLRAVGTTTGGVSSDAYSQVFYQTGGVLSIEFDPLPPQTTGNFPITGRYTLINDNPYTISIWGPSVDGWVEYIPVIDHATRTFSFNALLFDPPPFCGDGACCCWVESFYFEGTITQDAEWVNSEFYAEQTNPICSNGFTHVDDSLYTSGTGYIEGTFFLNVPGAHMANMMIALTDVDFNYHEFNVTDYDETLGTWQVYVDVTPSYITPTTGVYYSVWDTLGNNFICYLDAQVFSGGKKIRLDEKNKPDVKRNRNCNSERNKRQPKRTVDGN